MIDVESILAPDGRMKNTGPRFRPSPTARLISGTGYLAGSYPDGITTVEGVPVDATVRVLLRSTDPALDGLIMAETRSRHDGTWLVEGLNSGLRYDVIGRRDGFNDIVVAGVTPTSMVDITYTGDITINETFTGALGYLELVGGIPPYAASVVDPLPAGIFPVVNGRQLIIDGTTTDDDVFNSTVRITSSNGATKDVPVKLVVGFKAPANLEAETLEDAGAFSVVLTWEVTNTTQEVLVFKSTTPFDLELMPAPIATLTGDVASYTDDDVIEDDVFYYMAASVCESFTLYSDEVREVVGGDPYWDNVVSLLHFDGDFTDEKGIEWVATGAVTTTNVKMFGGSGKFSGSPDKLELMNTDGFDFGTGAFTIEAFINTDSFSNYPVIFSRQTASTQPGIAFQIRLAASGAIEAVLRETSTVITLTSTAVLTIGEWAHVAVQRDSDWSVAIYINGTKSGSAECPYNLSSDRPVGVGYLAGGYYGQYFTGHLDELRITKGVARYTENFTPPTKPFLNM